MHKATCLASLWLIPPEGQADMRVTLNIYVRHERRIRAKQTRIERRPDVAEATKTVAWLQMFMGMTTSFVPKFQGVHARHQKKEKHSDHGDQTRKNTLYQGRVAGAIYPPRKRLGALPAGRRRHRYTARRCLRTWSAPSIARSACTLKVQINMVSWQRARLYQSTHAFE